MRRTQLYLDDDLWNLLHARAQKEGATISELVRQATRRQYLGDLDERRQAMKALVGIRKNRDEISDSTEYVRKLRRGRRIERLRNK